MSQNIKDKLSSFYNDVMTPMSSTNRSNNTAKVMLIPNRNRDITVNYEEIKKKEQINKVSLIAFTQNDIGNAFWKQIGWTKREDLNYYDFTLNEKNITAFNQ